jgi:hypothetical protein
MDSSQLFAIVSDRIKFQFNGHYIQSMFDGTVDQKGSFSAATYAIKQAFSDIGNDLKYCVSASGGIRGVKDGEWLYDLIWYLNDKDDKNFNRLVLVLESELSPGGGVEWAGEVDNDFMKLPQARADIRVWLACIPNTETVQRHVENCKAFIRQYYHSQHEDKYIFIMHDWSTGLVTVESHTHIV